MVQVLYSTQTAYSNPPLSLSCTLTRGVSVSPGQRQFFEAVPHGCVRGCLEHLLSPEAKARGALVIPQALVVLQHRALASSVQGRTAPALSLQSQLISAQFKRWLLLIMSDFSMLVLGGMLGSCFWLCSTTGSSLLVLGLCQSGW